MEIVNLYQGKNWIFDRTIFSFLIASLLILAFSFHQQYIEKIEPCTLCQWQRYCLYLIFTVSFFGFIQRFNSPIRLLLILIFFVSLLLSSYHTLVQFGWLTDRCVMTQKIENVNDFIKMFDQPKISCANINWKLFGISASIYNAIFSFFAIIALNFKIIQGARSCQKNLERRIIPLKRN